MILNKFYINVLIRVILIVLSGVLFGIILQHVSRGYYYSLAGVLFLIATQTWLMINQVNKTNGDLEKFFSTVQDHDSSIRFSSKINNKSFKKLQDRMNQLNTVIQNVKIENERNSHFLQSLVDHVDIGLLSFDKTGKIEIYNKAAKRYIIINESQQISAIEKKDDEIFKIINAIRPGQEILHKTIIDNLLKSVLIKAAEFRFENKAVKLVSFQDITNELDKKELDSWQKLIRVLTHEIMNSISPITSLTKVISGYFKNKDNGKLLQPDKIDKKVIDKTLFGLNTIEETGKGLLDFVDKYRSLTSLPKPDLSKFKINDLFRKCKLLMETGISGNIKITSSVYPENIELMADYVQVEQVLINLIKNATEAIYGKNGGVIQLKALCDKDAVIIQVEDNGCGISNDIIENIFVPFYTTKENGSGIGLSLSKQIMQNHDGTISVISTPDYGTKFTLMFQL